MRVVLASFLLTASWCVGSPRFEPVKYHTELGPDLRGFSRAQIAILEKLNRADVKHLGRLTPLIVPNTWVPDELAYSPLPPVLEWAADYGKYIVVHLPSQVFGAYEQGHLVRWGPVSSGRSAHPTPAGLFHLNWRARQRTSTDNAEWELEWYFNFHNFRGLAFHEYALPGRPASHACIRLLRRDAIFIYNWGQGWVLSDDGQRVLSFGTPVLIVGEYDFSAPEPWTDPAWWLNPVVLPQTDPTAPVTSATTRID